MLFFVAVLNQHTTEFIGGVFLLEDTPKAAQLRAAGLADQALTLANDKKHCCLSLAVAAVPAQLPAEARLACYYSAAELKALNLLPKVEVTPIAPWVAPDPYGHGAGRN